jgi:hypothetical protein
MSENEEQPEEIDEEEEVPVPEESEEVNEVDVPPIDPVKASID